MEENRDFGIKYTTYYGKVCNKFISSACIAENGEIIICENYSRVRRLLLNDDPSHNMVQEVPYINNFDIKSIAVRDNCIYVLDMKSNSVISITREGTTNVIFNLESTFSPLALKVSDFGIVVTCLPSSIFYFKDGKLDYINLEKKSIIEPIYVDQKCEDIFLVTDSVGHVIYEIDKKGEILWTYGELDNPGSEKGLLYMPMCSVYGSDDGVYVAEQRNHRILFINKYREINKIFGISGQVGLVDNKLWAPDFVLEDKNNKYVYAVLSKSGTITRIKSDIYETVYGYPLVYSMEFNFQRSCEWNNLKKRLLVADTGHNNVLILNADGKIEKVIDKINGETLEWPRCATWVGNDILISDSRNQRVLRLDSNCNLKKQWNFKGQKYFDEESWIQLALLDDFRNYLLVATSNTVCIFDSMNNDLLWTSDLLEQNFKDIHHVSWMNDGMIISDTGNNRLAYVDGNNQVSWITHIETLAGTRRLKKPRMAIETNYGILIVDSGNAKVCIINNIVERRCVYEFGNSRGMGQNALSGPRWACVDDAGTIYISDTDNHRIIRKKVTINEY